jgi:hypothetical protein
LGFYWDLGFGFLTTWLYDEEDEDEDDEEEELLDELDSDLFLLCFYLDRLLYLYLFF